MTGSITVFPDWISHQAQAKPGHTALVVDEKEWTFVELDAAVTKTSRKLATFGVRAGDRIGTLLHNSFELAVLPHAALRLGATLVPLNVRLSEYELAWQIGDSSPRVLMVDARTHDLAASALREHPAVRALAPDEFAAALESDIDLRLRHDGDSVLATVYTSGTTGRPKGAMLTVSNFWWSAIGSAMNLGTQPEDRWLACMPLFHVGGLSILIRSAIYGITAVVHDGFDETAVDSAIDDGVSVVSVVAVMLERMLDQREGRSYPSTLRCILLGGGPAPLRLLERSMSMSAPVVQTYGLTETCSQAVTLSLEGATDRPGASGKALYPNEIHIEQSAEYLSVEGAGEILVRGPIVMKGYAGQSEATALAIRGGWLHTGDIGRLDEQGYLYVLDRRDDLIVTGGENVYPAEVEAVLLSHPSVAEAGVIGIADDEWGQSFVAIMRLSKPNGGPVPDAAALDAYCRARLAGYKIPKEFRFVSQSLPRTASGKLRRSELREFANVRPGTRHSSA
ncbi:MAG: o-succinylbenzoate--CoA ligase [Gemmatimonadaceae bacterium]